MLSILLQARDEEGRADDRRELRDELMTLLVAGHETTATSLAWAFDLLLRHPDELARLQAEIEAGESDEYLDAVIKETLRIRPVVPGRGPQADRAARAGRLRAPGRHARRAEHLPHAPAPGRVSGAGALPARALPRAAAPTPTRGSRSAAASAAASARASRLYEMKVVIPAILRAVRAARRRRPSPSAIRRRAITFVPEHDATVVVEERRRAARRPAQTGAVAGLTRRR